MKGDPLLSRRLPPTLLIKHAVEVWPNKPDPEAYVIDQLEPGAFVWVRTRFGIKQRRLRLVRKAAWSRWRGDRGRRFVVAHDKQSTCHVHWLSDVIRVQPCRRELTRSAGG